ncbi:hypothetical protein G7075_05165 [Phycicoccus sp. HDW14]|uniref:hypothetical protein n=1 Tax=Phycicoccus sp. HDW14 TaxID=2714941 RepID=UPI00140D1C7F|nr:hypothetical protein [Phycicoccus sp. HDW14]QIM20682.1 hypothetical protein G7075_05165 [Phycicoccus sp. HDW14]
MSEQWTWTFEDASGAPVTGEPTTTTSFPTQSDAESWFGEVWRELGDAGVAGVTLYRDGVVVYGPMSLEAAP